MLGAEKRWSKEVFIPLTLEWSTSSPHDLLLAGCHDGTVALWKFTPTNANEETRPLLFFIADSFALRTIAWAPSHSGIEGEHIVATGGHSGHLKFWDLRDPFRPLWELRLSRGQILCMDWLEVPRCILVTLDDGTLRTISLNNALSDTPVTGKPFTGTQAQGVQSYYCSSFAIWNIQVCRNTGFVAYCSADGSVIHFELSEKAIEKGGTRYREPHYLCGAFAVNREKKALVIVSQDFQGPVQMKRSLTEWSFTPRSKRGFTVSVNQEMRASSIAAGLLPPTADSPNKKKGKRGRKKNAPSADSPVVNVEETEGFPGPMDLEEPQTPAGGAGQAGALVCKEEILDSALDTSGKAVQPPNTVEEMPSKLVAVHRVKWNPNKSSAGWVCYGGAAGIIRCRLVSSTT
ncbi:uncharacterized protein LOC112345349 isoform X2 [Selaginella moellendorffii]|uniref:uncharacterized protein LOC112345349 isoform X2 n=1 Tax=Selaginella moellendorffii TaxID=88036 RepID=UPI000D1CB4B3|nr:uncharacterized protein LOC112345349 isoform X2 [Selaginella moellendorffii]|eukprot:XP_024527606.1 uncharacterized protein LOC112345349 isoform X2 [Selaginella moellendorffii]